MYKFLLGSALVGMSLTPVFAQEPDQQLVDALGEEKTTELTYEDLQFEQFNSCDAMEETLETFLKEQMKNRPNYYYRMGGGFMVDDMVMMESAEESADMSTPQAAHVNSMQKSTTASSSNDFSQTNTQKDGVDEPDILKTDGKHVYYYNAKEQKIHIISSALDIASQTVDLSRVDVVAEIAVPQKLNQLDLLLHEDELIIIGNRYAENIPQGHVQRNNRTAVVRYDVSDVNNLELISYQEFDGYKGEVRLTQKDSTLYVLTNLSINRWYNYPQSASDEDVEVDINIDSLLPRSVSITPEGDSLSKKVSQTDCRNINYILPNEEQLNQLGQWPSFVTVNAIDLDDDYTKSHVLFGQQGQIHLSEDGLYIAQSIRMPGKFACPANARCAMPFFRGGQNHTLVHGFSLGGIAKFAYIGSNLVQGNPMGSQYSMDEHQGKFRMLTQTWNGESATHLFVFDESLRNIGSLTDIEPGERFQGSRFIGDKLYLITFEQIDPLFVIDLADSSDPTIIGELKMPGFSSYLHPLGAEENGQQYLLGIGYDTAQNQRGGTSRAGVKLDVYKVDYNKQETADSLCGKIEDDEKEYEKCLTIVDTSRIRVTQEDSLTLGEAGSYTPVTENPRLFVMDSNYVVTLPLFLQESKEDKKRCEVVYDNDGTKIEEECRTEKVDVPSFAGLKSFALNPFDNNDISEVFSKNYLEELEESYGYGRVYGYYLNQIGMRVGYMGDVRYIMTHLFADFILGDDNSLVDLSE